MFNCLYEFCAPIYGSELICIYMYFIIVLMKTLMKYMTNKVLRGSFKKFVDNVAVRRRKFLKNQI